MALASVLLAAAPGLAEGVACGTSEPGAPVARLVPALASGEQGPPARRDVPAALATMVASAGFPPAPTVVVVGTDLVGFRRLSFPFRDTRRVHQALRFALESELLDDVDSYAVDHDVVPDGEGACALVSLLKRDTLHDLLKAVQGAGLAPYRVLSAPHALLAAHPPPSPDHVQVYVGAEESFVTLVRGNRIDQVKALSSSLAGVLAELSRQDLTQPADVHRLLTGEADESRVNRSLLRGRLTGALEDVADQIGRFFRVQDIPAGATASVHGLYAPWVEADLAKAEARFKPTAAPDAVREALGILAELCPAPERLLGAKGQGFYRAVSSWRGLMAQARRPLIALGALILLLVAVAGATYTLRAVTLLRQLDKAGNELQGLVTQYVGANIPESARASVLRERLQAARERSRAGKGVGPYSVLGTFSDVSVQAAGVPGVTVEDLQIAGNQVVMTGQTPSYQAAEALRDRLSAIPRFRGRTVKVTYQRAGQGLAYRVTVQ